MKFTFGGSVESSLKMKFTFGESVTDIEIKTYFWRECDQTKPKIKIKPKFSQNLPPHHLLSKTFILSP